MIPITLIWVFFGINIPISFKFFCNCFLYLLLWFLLFWWFSNLGFKVVIESVCRVSHSKESHSQIPPFKGGEGSGEFWPLFSWQGSCNKLTFWLIYSTAWKIQTNIAILHEHLLKLNVEHILWQLALLIPYIIVTQMYLSVQSWRRASLEWYIWKKEFVQAYRLPLFYEAQF